MDRTLDRAATRLGRGSLMRLAGGRGLAVFVLRGQLWATQLGDRRDHIVGRGQLLALDRPGLALLEALEDTILLVVDAAAPAALVASASASRPAPVSAERHSPAHRMTAWEAHMMARRLRAQMLVRLQRRAAAGLRNIWRRLAALLQPRLAAVQRAATGPNGGEADHAQRA